MEDNNDNRLSYLRMIQDVIVRMASNSFAVKGLCGTLVGVLIALTIVIWKAEFPYLYLAILPPLFAFWMLDAFYLRQERLFRKLYDVVRTATPGSLAGQTFSMDTSQYTSQIRSLFTTLFSPSVLLFHGVIIVTIAVISIIKVFIR